jgi:hypothetical protein
MGIKYEGFMSGTFALCGPALDLSMLHMPVFRQKMQAHALHAHAVAGMFYVRISGDKLKFGKHIFLDKQFN